jgi:hypothetical protein
MNCNACICQIVIAQVFEKAIFQQILAYLLTSKGSKNYSCRKQDILGKKKSLRIHKYPLVEASKTSDIVMQKINLQTSVAFFFFRWSCHVVHIGSEFTM